MEGDRLSFDRFMPNMNNNAKDIVLSWTVSENKVVFLDLEIFLDQGHLCTKNYCKPTDRNSHLPIDSCHLNIWLNNIPKGQFIRVERNCSDESIYLLHSEVLANRFIEKGNEPLSIQGNQSGNRQAGIVTRRETVG